MPGLLDSGTTLPKHFTLFWCSPHLCAQEGKGEASLPILLSLVRRAVSRAEFSTTVDDEWCRSVSSHQNWVPSISLAWCLWRVTDAKNVDDKFRVGTTLFSQIVDIFSNNMANGSHGFSASFESSRRVVLKSIWQARCPANLSVDRV